LLGDFEEMYSKVRKNSGFFAARFWLWGRIFLAIPTFFKNSFYWSFIMVGNYIKVGLRNIKKNKAYSFINIFGLVLGITVCILIFLYVNDELSYDKFYQDNDRIFRVTREWLNSKDGESSLHLARCAPPIAPLLKNDYPHLIEETARVRADYQTLIKVDDRTFVEDRVYWAEQSYLKIFKHNFIYGNLEGALEEPNTIVLTKSIAEKYFGTINPVGQIVKYVDGEDSFDLKVTGVIENIPVNTHFKFDILGSFKTLIPIFGEDFFISNWGRNNYLTYLLLQKNVTHEELKREIPNFLDKHLTVAYKDYSNKLPEIKPSKSNILHLQRLTDIHLHSHLTTEVEVNGDINNIYIFSVIAFFTLLIACINFMNLATARSSKRACEIGVRKVLGAERTQLISQFLSESLFISFISTVLAVLITLLILPFFNNFVGKQLSLTFFCDPLISVGLIFLFFLVGIISGSYPAFLLSGFLPVKVLKGNSLLNSATSTFRKVLVVTQFAVSIVLIVCVGVVSNQMDYLKDKKLGFNKDQIVVLPAAPSMFDNQESFKNRLLNNTGIKNVAFSKLIPSDKLLNSWGGRTLDGDNPGQLGFRLAVVEIDYDFFDTYEMKIVAGRKQSKEFETDSLEAFVINVEAAKQLGWIPVEKAVDRPFKYGNRTGRVVGVVENVYFESLHNKICPQIYLIQPEVYKVSVKIDNENVAQMLTFLAGIWKEYRKDYPFEYNFLDEEFNGLYQSEQKLETIFKYFSILAIIIACLGLFGLASFTAEQKTKEIGIRKTLGASIGSIVHLLSLDFVKLVLIANLIAWPMAFYSMNSWLSTFAYSTDISIFTFVLSALIALCIALLTISFQSIKAALTNPIDTIKYE
jgi:putative ABC transport system permease protein